MFPHGSRFAFSNTVASNQRALRWPDHEIEFLAWSWQESRPFGTMVSFFIEGPHTTAQNCLGVGMLPPRLDEAAS